MIKIFNHTFYTTLGLCPKTGVKVTGRPNIPLSTMNQSFNRTGNTLSI
jgi:hypothetical protein